jgi:ribokinase
VSPGTLIPEEGLIIGIGVAVRDVAVWVDHHPAADEKLPATDFRETGGGPVATALVTLAGWGRSCAFAGVVGDDESGRFVRNSFVAAGVDVRGLVLSPTAETPASIILVSGEHRTICEWRQEALPLPEDELSRIDSLFAGCRGLLVDGRMPEAQVAAARRVRAAGGFVMLDAGKPRPGVDALLPVTDVAILSHDFHAKLDDGSSREEFLATLVSRLAPDGLRIAGLTLGAEGCVIRTAEREPEYFSAFPVDVEDTTGAGDVFHAGFAEALLAGTEVPDAARFSNAAAALKCRGRTGRPGLPSVAEIRNLADITD